MVDHVAGGGFLLQKLEGALGPVSFWSWLLGWNNGCAKVGIDLSKNSQYFLKRYGATSNADMPTRIPMNTKKYLHACFRWRFLCRLCKCCVPLTFNELWRTNQNIINECNWPIYGIKSMVLKQQNKTCPRRKSNAKKFSSTNFNPNSRNGCDKMCHPRWCWIHRPDHQAELASNLSDSLEIHILSTSFIKYRWMVITRQIHAKLRGRFHEWMYQVISMTITCAKIDQIWATAAIVSAKRLFLIIDPRRMEIPKSTTNIMMLLISGIATITATRIKGLTFDGSATPFCEFKNMYGAKKLKTLRIALAKFHIANLNLEIGWTKSSSSLLPGPLSPVSFIIWNRTWRTQELRHREKFPLPSHLRYSL